MNEKSDIFWDRLTGPGPAYVIAEGADAHYGSMERAREMIIQAKLAGADAIKFQHHLPDEEMLRDIPMSGNMEIPLYDFLTENALSIQQHVDLAAFAEDRNIDYLCTPFSWKAAQELEESLDLPAFKIGSGEFTDTPTLERIAQFGKPMILSTGMSTLDEMHFVYEFMCAQNVPFALMNCTSAYPPSPKDMAVGFVSIMQRDFSAAVIGHSDHSPSIATSVAALALGARVIEKHVTADSSLPGPDAGVSITFDELRQLVAAAGILSEAMTTTKEIHESEKEIRQWARRSLVYLKEMSQGSIVQDGDIWGKRPGTGVPSFRIHEFLGRTLVRDVSSNSLLSEADFE